MFWCRDPVKYESVGKDIALMAGFAESFDAAKAKCCITTDVCLGAKMAALRKKHENLNKHLGTRLSYTTDVIKRWAAIDTFVHRALDLRTTMENNVEEDSQETKKKKKC